jgi:hypothetical protein
MKPKVRSLPPGQSRSTTLIDIDQLNMEWYRRNLRPVDIQKRQRKPSYIARPSAFGSPRSERCASTRDALRLAFSALRPILASGVVSQRPSLTPQAFFVVMELFVHDDVV